MEKIITRFKNFNTVNETVQNAKSFLLKFAAQEATKKKKTPEGEKIKFTPEEEKEILNNPDYIEVRDYFLNVAKKPGLVYPFTYFRIAEGLPMTCGNEGDTECFSVVNLLKKINDSSPLFDTFSLPLGNIENYIKRKDPNDTTPAYEHLFDDLVKILEQRRPVKLFIDNFVGPIRREFAESLKLENKDPERAQLLDRIYNGVLDIKNLKPRINKKTGEEEIAEEQFIKTASKYKDTRAYPEFVDTYVAFKEFVNDLESLIEGWNLMIDEFIDELRSMSPSIKILYYDTSNGLVVTSARSAKGMVSVCKIANAPLCIRTDSNFWSYTSGKLQITFNELKLPKTDLKYLTSITIDKNRRMTDSANKVNRRIDTNGKDYREVLKDYGIYNEEAVEAIERNFMTELGIKDLVEKFERKGYRSKKEMILSFGSIAIKQSISQGEYSEEEMEEYKDLLVEIVKNDNEFAYKDVIEAFMDPAKGGFFVVEDAKLFQTLTDGRYDKNDIKSIMDLTSGAVEVLKPFLDSLPDKNSILANLLKEIIRLEPEVRSYVENNLL